MTARRKMPTFEHGENIAADLLPLVVPLTWIHQLPGNPRRGKVDALKKSYARFGQRKPLVVRRTEEVDGHPEGYTEAGNHGVQAMAALGWEYAAVVWVDESEEEAWAFSLADNQTHELGSYDPQLLGEAIARLTDTPDLLLDAGFDADSLTRLANAAALRPEAGHEPLESRGLGTPIVSTTIVFDDEAQQSLWYQFVRHLREQYPDSETTGERIALYVMDHVH